MSEPINAEIVGFEVALQRLGAPELEPVPGLVQQLSAPSRDDLTVWARAWPDFAASRRRWIAGEMLTTAERDFHVDFNALFAAMLDDPDPGVRAAAVDGLWESRDTRLVDRFVALLNNDADVDVRARAAAALGPFIEMDELGELEHPSGVLALRALVDAAIDEGEAVSVRRRAIESAGFAERVEVQALLEEAISSEEIEIRAGALCGMGNSADERWAPEVLAGLSDPLPELSFAATTAAGDLMLAAAVPALIDIAQSDDDRELLIAAIWALGEIGGRASRRALEALLETQDDPDVLDALDDAMASVALADGELPWSDLGDDTLGGADGWGIGNHDDIDQVPGARADGNESDGEPEDPDAI